MQSKQLRKCYFVTFPIFKQKSFFPEMQIIYVQDIDTNEINLYFSY